jgi:hypothetical protein
VSAKDYKRIRVRIAERRKHKVAKRIVVNDNNNNNTDNSHVSEVAKAYIVLYNNLDSKSKISKQRGFVSDILAKDVKP